MDFRNPVSKYTTGMAALKHGKLFKLLGAQRILSFLLAIATEHTVMGLSILYNYVVYP
jgi:hypothetical protein